MSSSKYDIVHYSPAFKNQVVELQKHLWSPSTELNNAYFEWKYECNPYSDSPLVYLALCEGDVVGMRGMFGGRWEVGNPPKTVPGVCAEDLVIAPDHRNRGLIAKIMKDAFQDLRSKGYSHAFSMSAGAVTFLSSLTMGWRNVGSMKPQKRPYDTPPFFFRLQRYVGVHPITQKYLNVFPFRHWAEKKRPYYYLDGKRNRRVRKISSSLSVLKEPRPEAMAELVGRIGHDGRIRHVRDRAYFAWRFLNPLSRYRFLFWEQAGLEGYMVLQEYVSEYMSGRMVNIVDWEALNLRVASELLRAAVQSCKFSDMGIWSATLSDAKKLLLRDAGFHPVEEGKGMAQHQHCLLVRTAEDEVREADWGIADVPLLDMAHWDIRMIFSTMG